MPNPNIEEKTTKRRKGPILGSGEISSAYRLYKEYDLCNDLKRYDMGAFHV